MPRCSKISEFRPYTSVEKALATCGVSGSDKMYDLEGYSNTGEAKRQHDLEPVMRLAEALAAYKNVKTILYA